VWLVGVVNPKFHENVHFFSDSDGIKKKTGLRIILEYRPNYINSFFGSKMAKDRFMVWLVGVVNPKFHPTLEWARPFIETERFFG
jgi:hypothetical protein